MNTLTLRAQLKNSIAHERGRMQSDINQRRAQIAGLKDDEKVSGMLLSAALTELSFEVELAKAMLACKAPLGTANLAIKYEAAQSLIESHRDTLAAIQDHERQIEDAQRTLDDRGLWEV